MLRRKMEVESRFLSEGDDNHEAVRHLQESIDAAVSCHRAKPMGAESQKEFDERRDRLFDDFLEAIDAYLYVHHMWHLDAVDRAGVSGRPPREDDASNGPLDP